MTFARCTTYSYFHRKSPLNEVQNRTIDKVQPVLDSYSIDDISVFGDLPHTPRCTTSNREKKNSYQHVALADHANPNEVYVIVDDRLGTYPQAAIKVANLLRKHGFNAEVANAQIGSKYYVKVHCKECSLLQ